MTCSSTTRCGRPLTRRTPSLRFRRPTWCASPTASSKTSPEVRVTTRTELFNVRTPANALETLLARLPRRTTVEDVPTRDALDRVLAEDLCSPADPPSFRRSTM